MAIKNKQILVETAFDINNQRLTNVSDPMNDTDAVNLKTLTAFSSSTFQVTLLNNSVAEEIIIGDKLVDRLIIIDYIIERNGIYEEGYIRNLNTDVDILTNHQFQNSGNTGVVYLGTSSFTDGTILITFSVSDDLTDAIFKYTIRKIKI